MYSEYELTKPAGRIAPLPFVVAWLLAGWLGFGAIAKFISPNPDDKLFDLTQAVLEVVILIAVLIAHRWRVTWLCVSMMFAGFIGWAIYALIFNVKCGCFGALWTPPAYVSLSVSVVFVILGVLMARSRAATRDMLIVTGVASLVAVGAGYLAYDLKQTHVKLKQTASQRDDAQRENESMLRLLEERGDDTDGDGAAALPANYPTGNSPIERVLKLEGNWDVLEAGPADPVTVFFVHDHHCSVCEDARMVWEPMMEDLAASGDPIMQIRDIEINELESEHGIESWNWEHTPNIYVVRRGRLMDKETWYWEGEDWIMPEDLRDRIELELFSE